MLTFPVLPFLTLVEFASVRRPPLVPHPTGTRTSGCSSICRWMSGLTPWTTSRSRPRGQAHGGREGDLQLQSCAWNVRPQISLKNPRNLFPQIISIYSQTQPIERGVPRIPRHTCLHPVRWSSRAPGGGPLRSCTPRRRRCRPR